MNVCWQDAWQASRPGASPLFGNVRSQIIDGKAIVYRVGQKLYVNQPRSGASALNDDDILVTRSIGNRLCNVDTVTLVNRASRFPRGFVILGDFVPYTKSKLPVTAV